MEDWEDFRKTWQSAEWLDESAAGCSQWADFISFVWIQLSLVHSPAHQRWLAIQEQLNEEEA